MNSAKEREHDLTPRHRTPTPGHYATAVTVRRAVVATIVVVAWTLLVGAYAWLGEPGWIEVSHHVVGDPAPGERPFRIVQLADLHFHRIGDRERRVAAAVTAAAPDLLVLGGDLVDRPEDLTVLDAFLALVGRRGATVAVLGNWERWSGVDRGSIVAVLSHRGARLLVNEALRLEHDGKAVAIAGLDDINSGRAEPRATMAAAAGIANVVAISHSPRVREAWEGPPPTFLLAAHTHGGQVTFLGYAPARPPGSGAYVSGWYRGPPFDAYVSRGIGTSILPIRFGARPEVAVFDWWLR
jgi:predicted MPP superfamily phosphohydrolase